MNLDKKESHKKLPTEILSSSRPIEYVQYRKRRHLSGIRKYKTDL